MKTSNKYIYCIATPQPLFSFSVPLYYTHTSALFVSLYLPHPSLWGYWVVMGMSPHTKSTSLPDLIPNMSLFNILITPLKPSLILTLRPGKPGMPVPPTGPCKKRNFIYKDCGKHLYIMSSYHN